MQRRDFSQKSFDHSAPFRAPRITPPPSPRFISEGPNYPRTHKTLPARWQEARLAPEPQLEVGLDLIDQIEVGDTNVLPIMPHKEEINTAIKNNPVTIIVTETGAGKSTMVPVFALEAGWDKIFITQPRQAAARNVYERIAHNVAESRPDDPNARDLVSFQTAHEFKGPHDAKIKVVTDGLQLVKELNHDGVEENEVLIIDEVHEWNTNIETLVAWVKQAIVEKPNLRVVLMSATIDAERLATYFADVTPERPPIIEVAGRNHLIEKHEKPDSTVVTEVVEFARRILAEPAEPSERDDGTPDPNGILVFLPGKREIGDVIDDVRRRLPANIAKVATILPLHAKLSVEEQQAAIASYPGVKIIVSTDVAQTSLTIPDIKYVVDSGLQRRMELDEEDTQGLAPLPISQADCDQRAGRTGRVGDGVYVLTRMDEVMEYIPYMQRDKYPTAEIERTDIVRIALRIAGVGLDFVSLDTYHSVPEARKHRANANLQRLGALAISEGSVSLTAIGERMEALTVAAPLSRMMFEAGRYPEPIRTYVAAIAASKEVGGLQYFAYNVGTRWKELIDESTSDHLAQLDLFIATQSMTPAQQRGYDLDVRNVADAQRLYRKLAKRVGFAPNTLITPTAAEREEIRLCVYAGLIDSIYKHEGAGFYRHLGESAIVREISNRSVIKNHPQFVVGSPYRVEALKHGEPVTRHILESVTAATMSDLGEMAVHLSSWKSEGFAMRGGRYVEVRRRFMHDVDLGVLQEVEAEPSDQLREVIIDHVKNNPGKNLRKLGTIKRELERLSRIAKDPVEQLTHDRIIDLINRAAPDGITDPTLIDNNLRLLMAAENVTLDWYVTPERRARIIQDAPSTYDVGDVTLRLSYRKKQPVVTSYRADDIEKLDADVFLPDGRAVYFMHERKKCTLIELQAILAEKKVLAYA